MKVNEIAYKSRKVIRHLQSLYVSWTVDQSHYDALVNALLESKRSPDPVVVKEVAIIWEKLNNELIKLLSKGT